VRITHRPGGLTIRDSPGLHWLLGGLFIVVGSAFVAGAFSAGNLALLAGGAGLIAIAAGAWVLARAPRSVLTIDGGVARLRGKTYPIADIADVSVVVSEDDESNAIYQVHLVLRDGARVPVSRLWIHDRAAAVAAADAVRASVVTFPLP